MKRDIGLLIRELRLAKDIGLNEFADSTGLNGGNFSRFEKGGGCLKLPETLYPIARELGTSVPALFFVLERVKEDRALLSNRAKLIQLLERVDAALARI